MIFRTGIPDAEWGDENSVDESRILLRRILTRGCID
jgi:hypothetical protein